jgi:hypothetical protein
LIYDLQSQPSPLESFDAHTLYKNLKNKKTYPLTLKVEQHTTLFNRHKTQFALKEQTNYLRLKKNAKKGIQKSANFFSPNKLAFCILSVLISLNK